MTNISADLLKEMKARLEEEEATLRKELEKLGKFEEVGDEEGENAVEIAQFGDNLSLEEELNSALKDVTGALSAMEKGVYGVCKYCKQGISEERLRIRPTSTSCVACKKTLTQEL